MAKAKIFGFGAEQDVFYREIANFYAGKFGYDPSFDITPSRLYCSYTIGNGPFRSDVQRDCCLRSAVLYLLDMQTSLIHPEAYDFATQWLLTSGWPFTDKGTWSAFTFEDKARAFLEGIRIKYTKPT